MSFESDKKSLNLFFFGTCLLFFGLSDFSLAAPWPALPIAAPVPADNPVTSAKIHLGQELFFDARLSKDGTVSCNSCHSVMSGGTDNRSVSAGINGQRGNRSAPTVFNAAFNSAQFWDGRANSLEDQAKGPLTNPIEMGMPNHAEVIARLKTIPGYVAEFEKVFPGGDALNIDNLAKAIATYERTLITPNSPYDRYANGETSALPPAAVRGMNLAVSVGCINCHDGANFNGPPVPVGKGNYEYFPTYKNSPYVAQYRFLDDKGRGAVTQNPNDDHLWKIPTWRNIALTAPYFHNGAVKTLPEAVRVMASTQLDTTLNESQVSDIVEFLNALTGDIPEQTLPKLPATPGNTIVSTGL